MHPPFGSFKLNYDGSVHDALKKVAVGGVFRTVVGEFYLPLLQKSSSALPSLLRCGLSILALALLGIKGYINFIVESDSLNVVNLISKGCDFHHPCATCIIKSIGELTADGDSLSWRHALREANELVNSV